MEYFPAVLCVDKRFMKSGNKIMRKYGGGGGRFFFPGEIVCGVLHVVWRAIRNAEDRK